MNVLAKLSPEQSVAAKETSVPICILAGAGSGKTRVITHRIAHLVLDKGVRPYQILGLTFTNKAAKEMRERVSLLLPDNAHEVVLGTFHGLAAKFLRFYGELVGVPRDFLIYDEEDATRLIKKIIRERFDLSKEELSAEVHKVLRLREQENKDSQHNNSRSHMLLGLYQERLQKVGALDFNGLLEKFCTLLEHKEGYTIMTKRIRHVVVDEYQDINAIQSRIVHLLCKDADSAAIVGDDDQSIYGWRGASATFMQSFINLHSSTKLFRLEDNYRSTTPILDAANSLISHNKMRLGKSLRSMSGDGKKIGLKRHYRDNQEAFFVVEEAIREFHKYGSKHEVAILMRTNAQSRPFEEALHKARMPYRMIGGMRFYDRKEIRDVLAGLKCALYPQSDVDLLRLLNALPFGIGAKTQEAIARYASSFGMSFFEVLSNEQRQEDALGNTKSKKKLNQMALLINEIKSQMIFVGPKGDRQILRADEALIFVIDRFGFAKYYEQKGDDESESRLENIEQLVQASVSFVEEAQKMGERTDIQSFLENVALVSKDESIKDQSDGSLGSITLMTLHAAKGLEFDSVFLVGLEEGILPHSRSLEGFDEKRRLESLEEERRLMYVGMTRAKSRLFLSFCEERFMHGKTSPTTKSRFLQEIPASCIEPADQHFLNKQGHISSSSFNNGYQSFKSTPKKLDSSYSIEYDLEPSYGMAPGTKVYHEHYQSGHVLSVSGSGNMLKAKVKFDDDGEIRTIMKSHLRLI